MDLPQPPADQELKNIIDKLAQFVARNGPEFEHMTKQKQKDNPKFSFLFGGSYFHYYQYRVTSEQAILKQKQREAQQAIVQHAINRQSIQSAPWQQHLHQMQDSVQEQIRQSEQNLAAQHQLLLQQQQVQVDEVIRKAQDEKITSMAEQADLDLKELDSILQPIIDSCTKDSISTGKGWIFGHANDHICSEVIILYILKKVTAPGATFEVKLRLVYLINDVLHHSNRKNAEDLKSILERAVVPIFCSTSIGVDAEKQQKLSKLHRLWETNNYFPQAILDQLKNPATSLAAYQASLIAEHAALITPITTTVQNQYALLQQQHQDFVAHLTNQIHHLQQNVPFGLQTSQNAMLPTNDPFSPQNVTSQHMQPVFESQNQEIQDPRLHSQVQDEVSPLHSEKPAKPLDEEIKMEVEENSNSNKELPSLEHHDIDHRLKFSDENCTPPMKRMSDFDVEGGSMRDRPEFLDHDVMGGPPNGPGYSRYMDDYSPSYGHPHPGYMMEPEYGMTPPHMPSYAQRSRYHDMPMGPHDMPPPHDYMDSGPPPCVPPYYDLPAGLMVPLVKLEDNDYEKPLDPDDICLPPPALPTDRLLAAVEQFYCPPTHERARNNAYVISSEGWEQLGLYEFFKAKSQARKQKGLIENINDECGDYPNAMDSPTTQNFNDKKPQRRRYREIKSPEKSTEPEEPAPPKNGNRNNRHSRSLSRSRSRSRSKSPASPIRSDSASPQRPQFQMSSRGHSRSPPSRGRSHSPPFRARSRSTSPRDRRSRSPPSRDRHSRSPPSRGRHSRSPSSRDRRSRSLSPRDRRSPNRSPTPPFFGGGGSYPGNPHERRLDESNKGHQLLKKMGWSGSGLGVTEQGIQDPVDAGDVRDRQDMYKGIGLNLNDPYENFRKSKGQAFINRMKARAEELGKN